MTSILTKFLEAKPVLVISFDYEYKGVSYHAELSKQLACEFCSWSDIALVDGCVTANAKPLTAFSFVVIGTIGPGRDTLGMQLGTTVHEAVVASGVPYFAYGRALTKVQEPARYAAAGVPTPKTIICAPKLERLEALNAALGFPLISKPVDGSQGSGVTKHADEAALKRLLTSSKAALLIFQQALTASCDYRAFFIYDELMYVDKRSATKKGEFRHNVSLGGSIEKVDLPADALSIAKAAQRAMGFDASGVDLLQDEPTGKWYVLEVNSAPQFSEPNKVLERLVNVIKSKT